MTAVAWLWARAPVPPGAPPAPGAERGEEFGKTSPIALVVILLLGLATALLIRSMNRRLRNLPDSFETSPTAGGPSGRSPDDDRGPDAATRSARTGDEAMDRTEGPPPTGSP